MITHTIYTQNTFITLPTQIPKMFLTSSDQLSSIVISKNNITFNLIDLPNLIKSFLLSQLYILFHNRCF